MTNRGMDERAWAVLDEAARELLPVAVDLGLGQPKLDAYVDRVEADARGARLHLAPIAGTAIAAIHDRVCVRPALSPGDWELRAHAVVAYGERAAVVDLTQARLVEHVEGATTTWIRNDLLVLVVPGGLHDRSVYVFPVTGIAADACEIQATLPLDPGTTWDAVEIIGDRKLLRRASAHVLDAVPWYLADGSPCFRCQLALAPVSVEGERPYDLVTEATQVRRLLDFAGMTSASGYYEAPGWGRGALRFLEVGKDAATLELQPGPRATGLPQGRVRVGVELLAVQYEMEVRVLDADADRARTSLPLILRRRRRHRRAHRVPVPAGESVRLSFVHPVTGSAEAHPVRELSFYGVSFRTTVLGSVLWKGLPLERAHLDWRGRTIPLGDLVVEETQGLEQDVACVASITDARIVDDTDMIALLATLAHPDVRVHDGADFEAMHAMYLEAGLFAPHMHRNLAPIVEQTKDVWRRLHAGAPDVVRTLVHGPAGAPHAAVTALRAWENAWVSQHFIDVGPPRSGATGSLQTAHLEHLIPRPDGRYLLFFVKTDNHVMNAYFRRFCASVGTPEAVSRPAVELWSRAGEMRSTPPPHSADVEIRAVEGPDEVIVERAAARCLGPGVAAALSMRPGETALPDCRVRFARAGLERSRDCRLVWRAGQPVFAILEERATPGLNLTWMLNANWILSIHPALDVDGAAFLAALADVVDRAPQAPSGERFLNLPEGMPIEPLTAAGFQKEATVYAYVLNRAGLHRCYEFARSRYGESEALLKRRAERGPDAAPGAQPAALQRGELA